MNEEMIQVIDPQTGEPTGQNVTRKELFKQNLWCRSTNVFVVNSAGQILCHQRSQNKERFPGVWSTHFGGHVSVGESFKINAVKEVEEEIGFHVNVFQMIPWRTHKKENSHLWMRDFLTVYDGAIEDLVLQKSEVEQVKFMSIDEIVASLNNPEERSQWADMAGVYSIEEDYQALRAVLTACLDMGIFGGQYTELKKWNPVNVRQVKQLEVKL